MDQADAMRRAVVLQERFIFPCTNFKLAFFLVMCNGIAIHGTFTIAPESSSTNSTRTAPPRKILFCCRYSDGNKSVFQMAAARGALTFLPALTELAAPLVILLPAMIQPGMPADKSRRRLHIPSPDLWCATRFLPQMKTPEVWRRDMQSSAGFIC